MDEFLASPTDMAMSAPGRNRWGIMAALAIHGFVWGGHLVSITWIIWVWEATNSRTASDVSTHPYPFSFQFPLSHYPHLGICIPYKKCVPAWCALLASSKTPVAGAHMVQDLDEYVFGINFSQALRTCPCPHPAVPGGSSWLHYQFIDLCGEATWSQLLG